jgi:hypothetical protein
MSNQTSIATLVLATAVAFGSANVQAGNKNSSNHSSSKQSNESNNGRTRQMDGSNKRSSASHENSNKKHNGHHGGKDHSDHNHGDMDPKGPVIDPGKGDGKPPTNPTPVTRNGFTFVNGHWERVKADQGSNIVVRDHRGTGSTGSNASGGVTVTNTTTKPKFPVTNTTGPIIRDHRGDNLSSPSVRDHRGTGATGGNASGGVTVTNTPPKPKSLVSSTTGPTIRDHRGYDLSSPLVRDHRNLNGTTAATGNNLGPVIRDHR